jgi:CheY-like chemotaxis protein
VTALTDLGKKTSDRAVTHGQEGSGVLSDARDNPSSILEIFVAEEDDKLRAEIVGALRQEGHIVVECADGATLFQQLERRLARPGPNRSIVIAQARLPGVGALRVFHSLHALDVQIPMVLMTWIQEPTVQADAEAVGAAAVLTKPVQLPELHRVVNDLMARMAPSAAGNPSRPPAIPR